MLIEEQSNLPEMLHEILSDDNVFRYIELEGNEVSSIIDGTFLHCNITKMDFYWNLFNCVIFIDCAFNDVIFRGVNFSDCRFLKCKFTNCEFIASNTGHGCIYKDTIWVDVEFVSCKNPPVPNT